MGKVIAQKISKLKDADAPTANSEPKLQKPFACEYCRNQPTKNFAVFKPLNDWLVAYPEQNLIHVHLGQSVQTKKTSMEEANFQFKWVTQITKKYPKKKFFFVIDMGKKDDSEMMPPEARKLLQKIITHPQLPKGAAYGLTWAWRMVGNLLVLVGADIKFVDSEKAAHAEYKKWKKSYRGK